MDQEIDYLLSPATQRDAGHRDRDPGNRSPSRFSAAANCLLQRHPGTAGVASCPVAKERVLLGRMALPPWGVRLNQVLQTSGECRRLRKATMPSARNRSC